MSWLGVSSRRRQLEEKVASRRYFAIGLKNWVQIRVAMKPPKAVTTCSTTTIQSRQLKWILPDRRGEPYGGHYEEVIEPKELKLEMTVYEGGRTLVTIPLARFIRLFKASLREGCLMELMAEQISKIKELRK